MRFQPLVPPRGPASERTSAASFHDHRVSPFFRPSAAAATGARDRAALLSASIHGPLIPPPSPGYTAATPWLSHDRWSPQATATAGVDWRGATRNGDRPGTRPTDLASPLRPGTGCCRGAQSPPPADGCRD